MDIAQEMREIVASFEEVLGLESAGGMHKEAGMMNISVKVSASGTDMSTVQNFRLPVMFSRFLGKMKETYFLGSDLGNFSIEDAKVSLPRQVFRALKDWSTGMMVEKIVGRVLLGFTVKFSVDGNYKGKVKDFDFEISVRDMPISNMPLLFKYINSKLEMSSAQKSEVTRYMKDKIGDEFYKKGIKKHDEIVQDLDVQTLVFG